MTIIQSLPVMGAQAVLNIHSVANEQPSKFPQPQMKLPSLSWASGSNAEAEGPP